jgi:hypothetical protein
MRCSAPLLFAMIFISAGASAQLPPPVHTLGPVLATSTEPLAAVSQVRALPGGRVLVNDYVARRVLMFDSTFQHVSVVMDTATNPYGLIGYRGDSTLCVDLRALAMLVIDGNGAIGRSIAIPDSRGVYAFLGGPYGTPGLDARGRLVYALLPIRPKTERATGVITLLDSAPILRFDLASRVRDSVTAFAVPQARYGIRTSHVGDRTITSSWLATDPIPWTDDWTVLSDGTIAVVHGREYRVDFIDPDGSVTRGPKLPFEWQHLADSDKAAIIDSAQSAYDRRLLAAITARQAALPAATKSDASAKPGPPQLTPEEQVANSRIPFVTIEDMPDYRPAFEQGDVRGDADGRLWIRTSKSMNGGSVYDVINNKGILVDRIAVPPGRVIAGFGSGGVVYMGVLDGNIARLERARVH